MKPHRFEHGNKANLISNERRKFQPPEEIVERSGIHGGVVVDLGCGNGYLTLPLADIADKVIAIDAQKEMLESLVGRSGERSVKISPVIGELPSVPLASGSVDHVFIVNMLHELEDRAALVEEVRRVLKEKGGVTIVDFQKKETTMGPPLHERIDEADVPSIFKGFEMVKRFSFDAFYQFELRR